MSKLYAEHIDVLIQMANVLFLRDRLAAGESVPGVTRERLDVVDKVLKDKRQNLIAQIYGQKINK